MNEAAVEASRPPTVLLVDDDPFVRFGVRDFLDARGWETHEATDCSEGEERFRAVAPDVAVIDHQLPDGTALDLLARLRAADPVLPVVVLTGHGSIELAVRAIQGGADQFLTKPVDMAALDTLLTRLVADRRARQRAQAETARETRAPLDPFLGGGPAIRALAEETRRALHSSSPVLLLGETGSGKGVLAHWIHANGPRADAAYVDLNCAGLSREFLESELFGHVKGAYTGAVNAKPGLLEIAHRGSVFLDEIGDMDVIVQARLLKVLEDKRFRRMGEVNDRQVDVRLVAATHHDLQEMVREKQFREDLYYRISALPLRVPPLRERREDFPVIARELLARLSAELGRPVVTLAPDAEERLLRHDWPGNIRELRNVLERALLRSEGRTLSAAALRFEVEGPGAAGPVLEEARLAAAGNAPGGATDPGWTLEELEKNHIARALAEEGGHVERAARRLGIPRSTLYERLKRYGMSPGRASETRSGG